MSSKKSESFPKTAFVSGATGFLGSHIARQLAEAGVHVRALVRNPAKMEALEGVKVEAIQGDLDDEKALAKGMKGAGWVFHAAASVNMWKNKWAQSYRINVLGTRHMVRAAQEAGVDRFVYTSSISTIGKPEHSGDPVDEHNTYNMEKEALTYPHTKWLGEKEVERAVEAGLHAVIVHPGSILGPGDLNINIGRYLFESKQNRLVAAPDKNISLCDVRDVARGHILAAEKGKKGEHYILSGENMPIREFFAMCGDITGGMKPLFNVPKELLLGAGKLMEAIGDLTGKEPFLTKDMATEASWSSAPQSAKAEKELGYHSRPVSESLADTYSWYQEKGLL